MGVGEVKRGRRPAVFLDRDGTLVRTLYVDGVPRPVDRVADLEILPGTVDALHRLHAAGFVLVVVTNQPDVARGTLDRATVEAMHTVLRRELPVDTIACCFHDDSDGCACRKPAPGMLIDAAEQLDILLPKSFMIGDRWRDIEAGKRAGCTTILLRQPYSGECSTADYEATNLSEAADIVLRCRKDGM